jgi:hypothetical protein
MAICESCSARFEPAEEVGPSSAAAVDRAPCCSDCRAGKAAAQVDELSEWFDQAVEADRAASLSSEVSSGTAAHADLFEPLADRSEPVGDFPEDSPAGAETVAAQASRPQAVRGDIPLACVPVPEIEVVDARHDALAANRAAAAAEPAVADRRPKRRPEALRGATASLPRVPSPPELGTMATRVGWALTLGLSLLGLTFGLRG